MSLGFTLRVSPKMQAGERPLYFEKLVWALSGKSLPSYREFFSLPPLLYARLCVTDRRILLVAYIFRICAQQFSLWYPGQQPSHDCDLVRDVSVGRARFLGPYLQIISENPFRHWYRSHELRVRLFMKESESVRGIVSEAMSGERADSRQSAQRT